ncbi:MAG: DUF748 domain-containing protein [Bacteroidota bacterium]
MEKEKSKLKKQIRNPIFWVVTLFILYMFIGFIIIPFIVRGQIVDFIQDEYNREARVESVSFNPFNFTLSVDGFLMDEKDRGIFLKWGHFHVNLNFFPLFSKEIDIEELQFSHPDVTLIKKREGFNFSDLIPPEEEADTSKEEMDWDILIRKLELQKLNVYIQDRSVEPFAEIHIDSIDILLTNIHPFTTDTTKFTVEFEIREGGSGSIEGIFTQIPMLTELSLDIDSISILPSQPYVSQSAYLRIDGGEINAEGNVHFEMNEDSIAIASYNGTMGMNNLNLFDTQKEEKFLAWNRLENVGVEINSEPVSLNVDSILIDGLYSRVAIAEDQTINAIDVFEPTFRNTDTTSVEESDSSDHKFDLGIINISNSEMYFSDFSLPIKFAVRIHSLNGKIGGISTGNPIGAIIDMEGTVDEYGYTRIEGNMDPFAPLNYTNIAMNFHNIDLTEMDGYSAKFVGYEVDKGKLSLDLEYLIKNGMLTSSNQIFFNQLILGKEVESEESLGPIIKLAIALLQDSEGNIDMDIEVEGDLNDPEVSTGKLVWWAVKRALTTIVTAPFRFLGNLLGISNGNELEFVDFKVADTSLAPHQIEKLVSMTKALNKRPGLSLGIYGAVDTVADKYKMQKIKFDSLFTFRLKEASSDESITTASADQELRREILETMYSESYSDSLLNILISHHVDSQNTENISAANIEDSDLKNIRDYFNDLTENIIAKQNISYSELLKLASERAEKINDFLIIKQKLPKERIAIKENEIYEYEDDDWVKCRLELGAL